MTKEQINHDLAVAIAKLRLQDYAEERKSYNNKLSIEQECQYIKCEYDNAIKILSELL